MVQFIPEEGSFSLSAYVEGPGYVTVIPRGYLVSRRNGEVWYAPLIPQLFYGASGQPLTTWRQYIGSAGEQVILSRSGGQPEVPREELFWRRAQTRARAPAPTPTRGRAQVSASTVGAVALGAIVIGTVAAILFKG